MRFLIYFCMLLQGLLFSLTGFGAGEVVPALTDKTERKLFILNVQKQIPFAKMNSQVRLDLQINGVQALREKFPLYDQWMQEKPDPLSIDIYNVLETPFHGISLDTHSALEIEDSLRKKLNDELEELKAVTEPTEFRNALILRGLSELAKNLRQQNGSYRGILVGLAQILSPADRSTFFKLANPWLQIKALEDLKISDQLLRESRFRAETLGLKQDEITVDQILAIAKTRIQNSENIFRNLVYLRTITQLEADEFTPHQRLRATINFLSQSIQTLDFGFATRARDPFIEQLGQWYLKHENIPENQFQNFIDLYLENLPKTKFLAENQSRKSNKLLARVVEVNPYLGIHRGCIGGDCSTTTSPMFPYSPWEHIFFILNSEGRFVGYVSATRVLSEGLPSLYLKDISGSKLSPALAESILYAFAKILPHYHAKRLLLASSTFTDTQNHFSHLKKILRQYNQNGSVVDIDFIDKDVREFIGTNSAYFASSDYYDNPRMHTKGITFEPLPQLEKSFDFKLTEATLQRPPSTNQATQLLEALKLMAKNSTITVMDFPEINSKDLRALVKSLANKDRLPLSQYYRSVEDSLAPFGLTVTKDFRTQNEEIFYFGHLRASDALATATLEQREESEKYLQIVSRQHIGFEETMSFVKRWSKQLNRSKRFRELVELYLNRLQPRDVFQLVGFAELGISGILEKLQTSQNQLKVEFALEQLLQSRPLQWNLPEGPPRSMTVKSINKLYNLLNVAAPRTQDEFETQLQLALQPFGLTLGPLKNPFLLLQIQKKLVKSTNAFQSLREKSNQRLDEKSNIRHLNLLKTLLEKDQLSREEFLTILSMAEHSPEIIRMAEDRIQVLTERRTPLDILELHILFNMKFDMAERALERQEIRPLNLSLLRSLVVNKNLDRESEKLMQVLRNFSAFNELSIANFAESLNSNLFTAKSGFIKMQNIAAAVKISLNDLTSQPEILKSFASRWLAISDVLEAREPGALSFTLKILTYQLDNNSLSFGDWQKLISRFEFLNQKIEFKQFIQKLQDKFQNENCDLCAPGLVFFILNQNIPDSLILNEAHFQRLLKSDHLIVKIFMMSRALQRKISLDLSETEANELARIAENGTPPLTGKPRRTLRKMALNILSQHPVQSVPVQKALFKILKNDPMNDTALLAGIAYLECGGDPFLALRDFNLRYNRNELQESENSKDPALYKDFVNRVQKFYQRRYQSPGSFAAENGDSKIQFENSLGSSVRMTCKAIFRR